MRTCSRCGGTYDDEHAFCPEDGTPLEAAPISKKGLGGEGLVGELVAGRYRIEKFLGGGGFGVVYRVRDERLDDVEALKIVKSDMLSAKDARETLARFNREAKLLRRLGKQSRHIVGVTNLGEDERLGLFFTMDYVAGGDLKEALKEEGRPFQLPRVLKIGQQICDALSTAHGFLDVESGYPDGVVHRDLKLENVMLVKRGGAESVKILDFGIAKILGGKTVAMNSNTEGPGTPGYAPPEQILNPRDIDHRSDIFPLGVILYRLATGREPWFGRGLEEEKESGGMSWMAIVDRTLREDPIPPSQFDDTLPNEFQAFIMKCLEKDKEDRFGTAVEAKAALARIERQLAAPSVGTPTGIFSGAPSTVDPSPAATLSGEPATLDPPLSNLFGATPPTVDSPPPTVDGSGEGESAPELTPQAGPAMGGIQPPSTPRPVATRRRRARNRDGAPSWLKKAARPGLAVAGLLALSLLGVRLMPQATQFDWGSFLAAAELGQVTGVQFRGVELRGTSSDPDVGRFEVPVGERDLQDLGRELEALGVAVDPEGRPASVRLESGDEGDPRTLVIEGVDGCEPCSPGADVELAAGWHRVRWEDEGPDTGTIVLADLEGGFPDAPIRVGPALAAEAGPARIFVGHGLRLSLVLPVLPASARVVAEAVEAEGGPVPGEPVDTQGGVVPADPAEAEVGQAPGGLADVQGVQAPAEGAPSGGGEPGGEPGVEDDAALLPVCSNLASVTITDFVYIEAEGTLRLDYELFFDAPGLETPPVQAVEMGLSFQIDDQPAGTADFTHLSPSGTVVRNGRAGYEGTRTVRLDEAAGGRSVDGVRLSARLRAEPVQPPNWPEGCAPPGFMESAGRDVVIPGTIVGAFSRGVLQFSLGQLQVSDDPERSLATRLAVELEGADWCGAGEFTLAVGGNEYDLGTAVHAFEVGETRTQQSIRFWATLEPGELPADVPDAAGEAQARVTARVYDQACSTLDLSTAVPVQEETVGPICLQKTPATAWEPCT